MRIITLGTGAGRPTLARAASAVGLEYEGETLLFDCGEGTQLQLMKSSLKWGRVSTILISHLHGDHVNGLPGLLGTLSLSDRQESLKVFGPEGIQEFLRGFEKYQHMELRYPLEVIEIQRPGIILESEMYQVETRPLEHSIPCWGYVFRERDLPGKFDIQKARQLGIPEGPARARLVKGEEVTLKDGSVLQPEDFVGPSQPGRSMAYCLDTRPCSNAARLVQGVDFLLTEATFDETYQKDANLWGHSTAADAGRLARDAQVGRLVLTHISQRYQDESVLLEEAKQYFPRVTVASDLEVHILRKTPRGTGTEEATPSL